MTVGGITGGGIGQQIASLKQEIGTAVVKQQLDSEGAAALTIVNDTANAAKSPTAAGVGNTVDRSV